MSLLHVAPVNSPSRGKQLLLSCALLGGTALILTWFSGGFPPPVWFQLLQVGPGFQGGLSHLPLWFLLGQALALAGAWGIWLVVLIGEGATLRRFWSEPSLPNLAEQEKQVEDELVDVVAEGEPAQETMVAPQPSFVSHASSAGAAHPPVYDSSKASQARQPTLRGQGPSEKVPVLVREDVRVEQQSSLSHTSLLKLSNILLQNPFEDESQRSVQNGPMHSMSGTQERQIPISEADAGPSFVFGNPFEGPLPEVFAYDKELQNMIKEVKDV